jgi:hypothetical protein
LPSSPSSPASAPATRSERRPPATTGAPKAAAAGDAGAAAAPAAPTLGTLRIDADVPGAQVFLDRKLVGTAPVTAENVSPGNHQVTVSAEGFEGVSQTVDVIPGTQEVTLRLREVRLDATLAVVHKHRLGSCTGQLRATPQGVRYETSNRDDGFAVALADLEILEVDYLQKNLRLKVRGGRQYDFTDPEGNADRLFVFHRDVVKVRDRLARGDTPAND